MKCHLARCCVIVSSSVKCLVDDVSFVEVLCLCLFFGEVSLLVKCHLARCCSIVEELSSRKVLYLCVLLSEVF